jgi:uncharacterized repeat protein (TIGR02543 family)
MIKHKYYYSFLPKYTITYNGNGSTGGTIPVDSLSPYRSGRSVEVLDSGTLTKTGYTFVGWNTVSGGSGTAYSPGDTFNISGNTTLYAQWITASYLISVVPNNSSYGSTTGSGTYNYGTYT